MSWESSQSRALCSINTILVFCLQAKSEEQVATEKQWLDAEKVWLMHRGGFAAAKKDTSTGAEAGKLIVKLEQTGEVLNVDEDDVEKVGGGGGWERNVLRRVFRLTLHNSIVWKM